MNHLSPPTARLTGAGGVLPSTGMPRGVLIGLAALVLGTLLAVATVRWSGMTIQQASAEPVQTRLLRFDDQPDGSVGVIDAGSGQLLDAVQGEQGFLRGALRALARDRRQRGIGAQPAFALSAHADGRLSLTDTATGVRLDLESFGPANAAVFARLLTLGHPPTAGAAR